MKKFAILSILVVISSLSFVVADEESERVEVNSETEVQGESNPDKSNMRIEQKMRVNAKTPNRLELRAEKREERKENREEFKARIKQAREEARMKLKECKEVRATAATEVKINECAELRAETKKDITANVKKRAEQWIEHLKKLQARIEESNLENKAEINAQITVQIEQMNSILAGITEESSPEEVRAAIQELKEIWKESHAKARLHALLRMNKGLQGVIQRGQHLQAKLEQRLEQAEEQGKNVEDAQEQMEDFNTHIAAAATFQAEAQAALESGNQEAAHAALKKAREELKEAHAALQAFMQALKVNMQATVEENVEVQQ